jgi:hypothetical protein
MYNAIPIVLNFFFHNDYIKIIKVKLKNFIKFFFFKRRTQTSEFMNFLPFSSTFMLGNTLFVQEKLTQHLTVNIILHGQRQTEQTEWIKPHRIIATAQTANLRL